MKKWKTIFGTIGGTAFLFAVACILSGCGTTSTYPISYADAESLLLERLSLDRDKMIQNDRASAVILRVKANVGIKI